MGRYPPLPRSKHLEAGAKIEAELRKEFPDAPFEMTYCKQDHMMPYPNLMGIGIQWPDKELYAAHLLGENEIEKVIDYFSSELDRHGKAALRA